MKHEMNLQHDPFTKIKNGTKTIEMRLYDEKRSAVSIGDTIVFQDADSGERIECLVSNLFRYASFAELYRHHDKVSIGYAEDEPADPRDMQAYYSEEKIAQYGVVGIGVKVIVRK